MVALKLKDITLVSYTDEYFNQIITNVINGLFGEHIGRIYSHFNECTEEEKSEWKNCVNSSVTKFLTFETEMKLTPSVSNKITSVLNQSDVKEIKPLINWMIDCASSKNTVFIVRA